VNRRGCAGPSNEDDDVSALAIEDAELNDEAGTKLDISGRMLLLLYEEERLYDEGSRSSDCLIG
jgi:hypothetical protein